MFEKKTPVHFFPKSYLFRQTNWKGVLPYIFGIGVELKVNYIAKIIGTL
jgi:hypothetical protein